MAELTVAEAYRAAFLLLEDVWMQDLADDDSDLAVLLGAMDQTLFEGGQPADPAIEAEWLEAARRQSNTDTLTEREAYDTLVRFLREHHFYDDDGGIVWVLDRLRSPDPELWEYWLKFIRQAKQSE